MGGSQSTSKAEKTWHAYSNDAVESCFWMRLSDVDKNAVTAIENALGAGVDLKDSQEKNLISEVSGFERNVKWPFAEYGNGRYVADISNLVQYNTRTGYGRRLRFTVNNEWELLQDAVVGKWVKLDATVQTKINNHNFDNGPLDCQGLIVVGLEECKIERTVKGTLRATGKTVFTGTSATWEVLQIDENNPPERKKALLQHKAPEGADIEPFDGNEALNGQRLHPVASALNTSRKLRSKIAKEFEERKTEIHSTLTALVESYNAAHTGGETPLYPDYLMEVLKSVIDGVDGDKTLEVARLQKVLGLIDVALMEPLKNQTKSLTEQLASANEQFEKLIDELETVEMFKNRDDSAARIAFEKYSFDELATDEQ